MDFFTDTIKKLGFGTMRMPKLADNSVDEAQVIKMVDMFMERGYRYFDTAYFYHEYKSEEVVGRCLVSRYPRESFILADKMPVTLFTGDKEQPKKLFQEQLERTGAGYFDMYLLHAMNSRYIEKADAVDLWSYVKELKQQGFIKHLGFSFHDSPEVLEKILIEHPEMEFVQLQINYADWEEKRVQARACYELCCKYSKPIIVMEPVKGGLLVKEQAVYAPILKAAAPQKSLVSWALRFVNDLPQVKMILSGMSDVEQMEENTALFDAMEPLNRKEQEALDNARKALAEAAEIGCTACKYCVDGCPKSILIPRVLDCLNQYKRYGDLTMAKGMYERVTKDSGKASDCIRCGRCENSCPQKLYISDYMQQAAKLFE